MSLSQKDLPYSGQSWCQQAHFIVGIKSEAVSEYVIKRRNVCHLFMSLGLEQGRCHFGIDWFKEEGKLCYLSLQTGWGQQQQGCISRGRNGYICSEDHAVFHVSVRRSCGIGLREAGFHFYLTLHQSWEFGLLSCLLMLSSLLNQSKLWLTQNSES